MKLTSLRAARIDRTRNNPFARRPAGDQAWLLPVTAMSLVLGFMIAAAWINEQNRSGRSSFLGPDQRARISAGAVDPVEYQGLQAEVTKLRAEKTKLENAVASGGKGEKALNESLQEAKVFAGLTEVEGPGIVVTLRDNPRATGQTRVDSNDIIHDGDVLRVVNELLASGAEAVSVNGNRHAAGTSYRCVGPTILVDGARIASPIVIRAIGDPATLSGGINLPGGILSEIRSDPNGMGSAMVQMETAKTLRLPAYSGSTGRKVARVPKDAR